MLLVLERKSGRMRIVLKMLGIKRLFLTPVLYVTLEFLQLLYQFAQALIVVRF